ncbi:MAG: hypothetical protein ACKVOG_06645 [Rhodoglobus sp.]
MGFLDNIKATVGTIKDGIEAAREADAAEAKAMAEAPIAILNPTPQEQIDAGLKRGVVRTFSYDMGEDDYIASMAVRVNLRARLAAGELGPDTQLKVRMSSKLAQKLKHGLEVPIVLDPATGIPTSIDTKALEKELSK